MPWSPSVSSHSNGSSSTASPSLQHQPSVDTYAAISALAKHNAIRRWQSTLPLLEEFIHFARVLFARHLLATIPSSSGSTETGYAATPQLGVSSSVQISYDDYCVARDAVGGPLSRFLTAQAFCKVSLLLFIFLNCAKFTHLRTS
jgi:hypothetical protein